MTWYEIRSLLSLILPQLEVGIMNKVVNRSLFCMLPTKGLAPLMDGYKLYDNYYAA